MGVAMEPSIQYARTGDGVSIALWTYGEGTTVVQTPPLPFSQVQLAAAMPEDRRWSRYLASRGKRIVRYDARGTGLSQLDVTDVSLDGLVRDLEAVVDQLALESFALWGLVTSGPVAITYAARHPERVSHLILWSSWARSDDVLRMPQARGLLALVDTAWDLFTETAAHAFYGWSTGTGASGGALHARRDNA
jgi:pimeloyl-ACP methyl ester carboxylesterase